MLLKYVRYKDSFKETSCQEIIYIQNFTAILFLLLLGVLVSPHVNVKYIYLLPIFNKCWSQHKILRFIG